jgi:hypothetical protein
MSRIVTTVGVESSRSENIVRIAVAMPWRPTSHEREANHAHVAGYLRRLLPEAAFADIDTGHNPFNLAAIRNEAVRTFASRDVIVIHDADLLAPPDALHTAIQEAAHGGIHFPFDRVDHLTEEATQTILTGENPDADTYFHTTKGSVGGVLVTSPATWEKSGGNDERFQGWGFEDAAFAMAARHFTTFTHHPGTARHLAHPHAGDPASRDYQNSRALCRRYKQAARSREDMTAIIREHNPAFAPGA